MGAEGPPIPTPRAPRQLPIERLEKLVTDFLAERERRPAPDPTPSLAPASALAQHSQSCPRAIDAVCRELAKNEPWAEVVKKGISVALSAKSLRDMLTEARKIPHLRDLVAGKLTLDEWKRLRPVSEIIRSEIRDDLFRKDGG